MRSSGETGTVAFVGQLAGKEGEFVGVELGRKVGKNNGSLAGERYFECLPGHGTFVRPSNVELLQRPSSNNSGSYAEQFKSAQRHSASASHRANEAYMEEFHKGYAALAAAQGGEGKSSAVDQGRSGTSTPEKSDHGRELLSSAGSSSNRPTFSWSKDDFDQAFNAESPCAAVGQPPVDPQGVLMDSSDQPLLCAALSPDQREVTFGGCDHGLRVFDTRQGKEKRVLFSKTCGHREWVTGCTYLPDGSVLSSGMDGKLCLWRGVRCVDLEGHSGSISKTLVTQKGRYAVSCSYDKTIRVWDLSRKTEAACFRGHKAPIMEMATNNGKLMTGARDGMALVWDVTKGQPNRLNDGEHRGQISSLTTFSDAHFASGDQAGYLRVWDLRTRGARAASACLHPGGAVSEIQFASDGSSLVSAGADKRIVVSDIRRLDQPIKILDNHKDFIYSLSVSGNFVISGAGDGMLLVHDLISGKLHYGLGANAAGIRTILCGGSFIVASGDDGNGMMYHY